MKTAADRASSLVCRSPRPRKADIVDFVRGLAPSDVEPVAQVFHRQGFRLWAWFLAGCAARQKEGKHVPDAYKPEPKTRAARKA